jgi:hypothetical protein
MAERSANDESARMRRLNEVLWPVIGHDLPRDVFRRIDATFDSVGAPETWTDDTERRMQFMTHVLDGLEAAYYHRDRIESIEREIVTTLRESFPDGSPPASAAARTPKISHEWIAYLNASRRTLEYLARAVSVCFGRSTDRIKRLANDVSAANRRNWRVRSCRHATTLRRAFRT